jgi:hypothetical protein
MTIFENKLKTKRKQGYSNLPFSVSAMNLKTKKNIPIVIERVIEVREII